MAYASRDDLRRALRAPSGSDTSAPSWSDGTFDGDLDACLDSASQQVDELCSGWAPFETAQVLAAGSIVDGHRLTAPVASGWFSRSITAAGEARVGLLDTPPMSSISRLQVMRGELPAPVFGRALTAADGLAPLGFGVEPQRRGRFNVGPQGHSYYRGLRQVDELASGGLGVYARSPGFVDGVVYTVVSDWLWAAVPPAVRLATVRIAARMFQGLRNQIGVVEVGETAVFEPSRDSMVRRWLSPWLAPPVGA